MEEVSHDKLNNNILNIFNKINFLLKNYDNLPLFFKISKSKNNKIHINYFCFYKITFYGSSTINILYENVINDIIPLIKIYYIKYKLLSLIFKTNIISISEFIPNLSKEYINFIDNINLIDIDISIFDNFTPELIYNGYKHIIESIKDVKNESFLKPIYIEEYKCNVWIFEEVIKSDFLYFLHKTQTIPEITENEILNIYINKNNIIEYVNNKYQKKFKTRKLQETLSNILNYIVKSKDKKIVNMIHDLKLGKFKFNLTDEQYICDIINDSNIIDNDFSSIVPIINTNNQLLMILTDDYCISKKYIDIFFTKRSCFESTVNRQKICFKGIIEKDKFFDNLAEELVILLPLKLGDDFNIFNSIFEIFNYEKFDTEPTFTYL